MPPPTDAYKGANYHVNIAIRYQFIRQAVQNDQIWLDYVPTHEQIDDVLTKALTYILFVNGRPYGNRLARQLEIDLAQILSHNHLEGMFQKIQSSCAGAREAVCVCSPNWGSI
jgi:hypothetical protein